MLVASKTMCNKMLGVNSILGRVFVSLFRSVYKDKEFLDLVNIQKYA